MNSAPWGRMNASGKFSCNTGMNEGALAADATEESAAAAIAARTLAIRMTALLTARRSEQLGTIVMKPQPGSQQRPERIVPAATGVEGVEEELRIAVEPGRNRCMARCRPAPGRFEQRLTLLCVRPEQIVGDC